MSETVIIIGLLIFVVGLAFKRFLNKMLGNYTMGLGLAIAIIGVLVLLF